MTSQNSNRLFAALVSLHQRHTAEASARSATYLEAMWLMTQEASPSAADFHALSLSAGELGLGELAEVLRELAVEVEGADGASAYDCPKSLPPHVLRELGEG